MLAFRLIAFDLVLWAALVLKCAGMRRYRNQIVGLTCFCNRAVPNCSHGWRRARARYQKFEFVNKSAANSIATVGLESRTRAANKEIELTHLAFMICKGTLNQLLPLSHWNSTAVERTRNKLGDRVLKRQRTRPRPRARRSSSADAARLRPCITPDDSNRRRSRTLRSILLYMFTSTIYVMHICTHMHVIF